MVNFFQAERNAITIASIDNDCDYNEQSNIETNDDTVNESSQSQPTIAGTSSKPDNSKKRRNNQNNPELLEQAALNRCMNIMSSAQQKDEYSIFGEYVATEMRLLKNSPDLQFKLKNAIQKTILDVSTEQAIRQSLYSSESSTTSFIMSIGSPASPEKGFFYSTLNTNSEQDNSNS